MMNPVGPSEKKNPDVSVLIVNYNGLRFLDECLESIKTAFSRYSYEVVVVDNASSDGSQAFLQARSDIRYIESLENTGFTGGNNLAARSARGKVLLLLNNDTRIEGQLDSLIDQALAEQVGAAGSRLVYSDGRTQFSVGFHHRPIRLVLSWLGLEKKHRLPSIFRRMETDPAYYEQSHTPVDWVSGACLATRREIWERLCGFDEAFFMYCEDVDYCLRVRNAGFGIAFVAETLVIHYEGAGRPWIGKAALQRTGRSYSIYLAKHHNALVARAASLGLAAVFYMRAAALCAVSLSTSANQQKRQVINDKVKAYLIVGWQFARQTLLGVSAASDKI
ncbi:glycosyltransferase family 2 protein [Aromatoleum evansii]|uniref:Glycosyltransferase family 2 protein n=1 Tax=Aromatoleum evansii TaxID=59406 RepID=A0ABZ1AG30_AROEV|nr:glycosyltransferase family 2 protein [Aromatoleum evansii]